MKGVLGAILGVAVLHAQVVAAQDSSTCPSEEHDGCCSCLSDEYPHDWDNGICCGACSSICGADECRDWVSALTPTSTICCENDQCADENGVPATCSTACANAWADFSAGPCRTDLGNDTLLGALGSTLDEICSGGTQFGSCPSSPPGMPAGLCDSTDHQSVCVVDCPADGGGHRRQLQDTNARGYWVCGADAQWVNQVPCGARVAPHIDPDDDSNWILASGLVMPTMSFGFEVYNNNQATQYMAMALEAGIRNFFASVLANNQAGVAVAVDAMEDLNREDIFICGSVTQCQSSNSEQECFDYTADLGARNLQDLGVTYVDQIMLDYPPTPACSENTCMLIKAQWRAFEEMHDRGEALSLAVSNYCTCHLDCLLDAINDPTDTNRKTKPVVNQLKYHLGMGTDPHTMIADNLERGILVQAYSSLAHGNRNILTDPTVGRIATAHGKSAAQVAYRWVIENGVSPCFSADSSSGRAEEEFQEDAEAVGWSLTAAEMVELNAFDSPPGSGASCYNVGHGRRLDSHANVTGKQ